MRIDFTLVQPWAEPDYYEGKVLGQKVNLCAQGVREYFKVRYNCSGFTIHFDKKEPKHGQAYPFKDMTVIDKYGCQVILYFHAHRALRKMYQRGYRWISLYS